MVLFSSIHLVHFSSLLFIQYISLLFSLILYASLRFSDLAFASCPSGLLYPFSLTLLTYPLAFFSILSPLSIIRCSAVYIVLPIYHSCLRLLSGLSSPIYFYLIKPSDSTSQDWDKITNKSVLTF